MNDIASLPLAVPLWFWAAATFLISACVGSFLNVVAARVPVGQSIVWPGSHCFTCGAPIAARHNIPVLSWFLLRGRCHNCRAPFSIRYALVELGFAVLCTATVIRHGGPTHAALTQCVLFGFVFPLSCIDLDTWTLPHAITLPGIITGLLLSLPAGLDVFLNHLLAAAAGYGVLIIGAFIGSHLLNKEAMGGGDFMLFALIGAFLGTRVMLPVIFLASCQGALVGIAMILVRKFSGKDAPADSEKEASAAESDAAPADAPKAEEAQAEGAAESASENAAENAGTDAPAAVAPAPVLSAETEALLHPKSLDDLKTFSCKVPDDGWTPDPHAIPFGPFLSLAAVEVVVFSHIPDLLFPWSA